MHSLLLFMLDIDYLFMWRATIALPFWRDTVAFRICGEIIGI